MTKKQKRIIIIVAVVVVLVLIYVIAALTGNTKPADDPNTNQNTPAADTSGDGQDAPDGQDEPEDTTEPTTEPYSAAFTAGRYTAGIDFPAGTYDLTAISGTGNVSSSNLYSGGLNEIMGISDNDLYVPSFNGAVLEDGVVLKIGGSLQLQLDCPEAETGSMKARENTATQEYTFSSGNYTCGTDFEPGEYVVTAIEGSGNVSSDNLLTGGINEVMGVEATDLYITNYKNVCLEDGCVLKVSGVTITLTPSK